MRFHYLLLLSLISLATSMDRNLSLVAKMFPNPELTEKFQLLEKRLKNSTMDDVSKEKARKELNAFARMQLKMELYKHFECVRKMIRSQEALYATLDQHLKDYFGSTGDPANTDLRAVISKGLFKLVSAYSKLQRGNKEDDDGELLSKMTEIRKQLSRMVRNNPAWQQLLDESRGFLDKAGKEMDILDPKLLTWANVKVEGLPWKACVPTLVA